MMCTRFWNGAFFRFQITLSIAAPECILLIKHCESEKLRCFLVGEDGFTFLRKNESTIQIPKRTKKTNPKGSVFSWQY